MKSRNKVTGEYLFSNQSIKARAKEEGICHRRYGTDAIYSSASPSAAKKLVDNVKYRGFKNHITWEVATYIQNNEGLHDMCKELYLDGYTSFGAMRLKLMEYGHHWKADALTTIYWGNEHICAREISRVLTDLFAKPKKK